MAAISDYAEGRVLNLIFNNDSDTFTAPQNYVALYTVVETDAGGGTECAATSYSRVRVYASTVSAATTKWSAPAATTSPVGAKMVQNAGTVTYPQAVDAFGSIKGFGIWDHATTGNLLWHGALAATKVVGAGDTFKFTTGNLKCTLA